MRDILAIADSVLKTAKSLGASESEAFVASGDGTSISIEKNRISAISSASIFGIGIRILKDARLGFAFCTEEGKIKDAVESAIKMSSHTKKVKFQFPEPRKFPKVSKIYDRKILEIEPEDGAEFSERIIGAAKEICQRSKVSGGASYGYGTSAIANSRGLSVFENGTQLAASASVSIGRATGFDISVSRVFDVDLENVGGTAADIALRSQKPKKADGGAKTVVFSPFAISQMIECITVPALYGDRAHRGESVYSEKCGMQIVDCGLSIYDNQIMPGGLNSGSTDDEGIASSKVKLIERGILKNFLCDLRTSYEFGQAPTSSGARSFHTPPATAARNIKLEGKIEKFQSLAKDIKQGIFAYDVMGAHTSNPASGDFSLSSSVLFEIKNGEVAGALKPVMLGGNLPKLLGKVRLADDVRMLPGGLSEVCFVAPSVAIEGVNVSV